MNRVVLDTNVVLDLLVFDDAAARPLRQALDDDRVGCVVSEATFDEWRRVLAYPGFGLDAERQTALLERYRSLSVCVSAPLLPEGRRMPRCSDPDDQKFLELAAAAGVQALISKDRAVLGLRRRCLPWFHVLTPVEAARVFSPRSAAGT